MYFQDVIISGAKFPISFGMSMSYTYEQETGRSFQAALQALNEKPVSVLIELIYYGLKDGHRKAKKDFAIEMLDLADMFDKDPEALDRCQNIFTESQVKQNGQSIEGTSEQKKTPSTGTN